MLKYIICRQNTGGLISQLTTSTTIEKTQNEVLHGPHIQKKKKVLDL